jgi:hypothetical protein
MPTNGKMSGKSWVVLECLIGLTVIGIICIFREPKYAVGVLLVANTLANIAVNIVGVQSGKGLPDQATDARPGQTSTTQTETSTVPVPPVTPPTITEEVKS